MLATQRVNTWPLNPGRCRFDQDRRVWACVPIAVLDELQRRAANSRALADGWPRSRSSSDASQAFDVDWPFLSEFPVHRRKSRSLDAEATSKGAEPESNTFNVANSATPAGSSTEESIAGTNGTLIHVGAFVGQPRLTGYRSTLSDGTNTPTSQYTTSLSFGYVGRPHSRAGSATPTMSASAHVPLIHHGEVEDIASLTRRNSHFAIETSGSLRSSTIEADHAGARERESSVDHPISRTIETLKHEARQARRSIPSPGTVSNGPSQSQKRQRSETPDRVENKTDSEAGDICQNCKRRKTDNGGPDSTQTTSDNQK